MRAIGWLALLAAVGYGAWWWWRRSGGANPLAFLDPPTGAAPSYYTPPAVPFPPTAPGTVGGGWADTAGDLAGTSAYAYCLAQGGDPGACKLAGMATNWVTDKAAPKVWEATKWTGSKVKSGLKAIIPGW